MLTKRIIPCLDVKQGVVVKGLQFQNHQTIGNILELAMRYVKQQADELVFYDIIASSDNQELTPFWVKEVGACLDIPFCVAGGIRSLKKAEVLLNAGADKISINSPALENPDLINDLVDEFGSQCVVVGIDSLKIHDRFYVCQYTGNKNKQKITKWTTQDWVTDVQARGAGEIVLNCMDNDGMQKGFDLKQLQQLRPLIKVPLIASGGAGTVAHFIDVFKQANVEGALAASVFHHGKIAIPFLKQCLAEQDIEVRQ